VGYNPSYNWINPTYPIYNWGYNPLTKWDEPPSRSSEKERLFSWIFICATLLNRFWGRTHPLSCQTKAYVFSHGAPTKRWRKARSLALEEPETLKEPATTQFSIEFKNKYSKHWFNVTLLDWFTGGFVHLESKKSM